MTADELRREDLVADHREDLVADQLPEITPLARRLLSRVPTGTTVPRYGEPEWDALPDQDPRRAAAIMKAAEAWRQHISPEQVAADLLAEMAATDLEIARRVRETSWDVHAALYPHLWDITTPHQWTRLPVRIGPTMAELREARTDYDGGPWAKERAKKLGAA